MNSILKIKNLSFSFNDYKIFDDVNLKIDKGEFIAVIGENGAGKSTLFSLILGDNTPKKGDIFLFSDNIKKDNHYKDIAYISQNNVLMYKDFPTTVKEVINIHLRYLKISEKVDTYLKLVELQGHANNTLSQLSGGQLQRVALAIALIKNAKLIILDEPTSGIDKKFSKELFKILRKLADDGKTIIMSTHNLRDMFDYVDKVVSVADEKCSILTEYEIKGEMYHHTNCGII